MLSPAEQRRLRAELKAGRGLLFIRTENGAERQKALAWVESALSGKAAEVMFGAGVDPLQVLLDARGKGSAIVADGADRLDPSQREVWLRAFNTGRDLLRQVEVPVVVLASGELLDAVAQGAPDLWSWRAGVYEGEARGQEAPDARVDERAAATVSGLKSSKGASLEEAWRLLEPELRAEPHQLVQAPGLARISSRVRTRLQLRRDSNRIALVGSPGAGVSTALWEVARAFTFDFWPVWPPPDMASSREAWLLAISMALPRAGIELQGWRVLSERLVSQLPRSDREEGRASQEISPFPPWDLDDLPAMLWRVRGGVQNATLEALDEIQGKSGRPPILLIDQTRETLHEVYARALIETLDALESSSADFLLGVQAGTALEDLVRARSFEIEEVFAIDPARPDGQDLLLEMLRRRGLPVDEAPEVWAPIVDGSAGLPRELIQLARDAVLDALTHERRSVGLPDVASALARRRRVLQHGLSPTLVQAVEAFYRGRPIEDTERAALERMGILIRYPDGLRVHPLLRPR